MGTADLNEHAIRYHIRGSPKCYTHLRDKPGGPVRSPCPQPMQASSADIQAHPAGLFDIHPYIVTPACVTQSGTCDAVKMARHVIESYIAVRTGAALDSIAPAVLVVSENPWRNYERRDEAIASGRLAQGGALSRRIIFFAL